MKGWKTLTLLFSCIQRCCRFQAYGIFEQRGGNNRRAMDLYNMAIRVDERHSAAWLAKAQVHTHQIPSSPRRSENVCEKSHICRPSVRIACGEGSVILTLCDRQPALYEVCLLEVFR